MIVMKVQYISSVMFSDDFAAIFKDETALSGQQAQKYHRLMIEGLSLNKVEVRAVSAAPITRQTFHSFYYKGSLKKHNNVLYRYLPVVNLPGLRNVMQFVESFFSILNLPAKKEQVVICDVLNATVSFGAALAAKLCRIPCVGVVTDLPDMMVTCGGKQYVKMVNHVTKLCSHFAFLTEQMNKAVNSQNKPYCIVEGLCDIKSPNEQTSEQEKIPGKCIYAGLLDARYGVKKMVEAFSYAKIPGAKLHIYGAGPYARELKEFSLEHPEIIFHGVVLNQEVVCEELSASLLVNPRPSNEEFTKYSFPSKNMEYMASGTPVLTTNLPGIPREYGKYVYCFKNESVEGMADTFAEVLTKSNKELSNMGQAAKVFVMTEKNNVIQTQRIIHMLENKL